MHRFPAFVWLAAALALLPAAGVAAGAAAGASKARTHTVVMDSTRFEPAELTVRAGDTIVWVNKDMFPHTATSKAGGFDSEMIAAGKSWTYTTKAKGTFPYTCTFHPTMNGTLRVQ